MKEEAKMARRLSKLKILSFTPHADDIEIAIPFTYLESLRRGHDVVEVLMTGGEYSGACYPESDKHPPSMEWHNCIFVYPCYVSS